MSIVGIYNKTQPLIGGLYFDAILEESSELVSEVSEYPLEDASIANDNAVTRPLTVTMTVALSDNWYKTQIAKAKEHSMLSGYEDIAGVAGSVVAGMAISQLSGKMAALAGLASSIAIAKVSGDERSTEALKKIREKQSSHELISVVGVKCTYDNMIITSTRTVHNKENEGGLELVIEMRQIRILPKDDINSNLPLHDSASTQGQARYSFGEVPLL